jgi:hypothetical protein
LQLIDIHSFFLFPHQPTSLRSSTAMSSSTAAKIEDRQQGAATVNIETTQQDAIGTFSMSVFYKE